MSQQPTSANRLINATSPYLLQHAHNPVDWYEWGEEALQRAKKEDKPILVSIGYSACHWCHVMERESFENADIAQVMNAYFVCIKVDREERPDIDQVYMEAVQAMGLQGGWPLNVFLTPDQKPFYGGTYYPPQSWVQLLQNINRTYLNKREDIETTAAELTSHLAKSDVERFKRQAVQTALNKDLQDIYQQLRVSFDTVWGGMNKAPKFVMPSTWMFLLRHHYLTGNQEALKQTTLTLDRILMGGIHDQLGGGFARYSVDGEWFAPHFEKMLYDNAQLLSLYAEAYSATGDVRYPQVMRSAFDWLQREMRHPEGGFYSALDADSEGEEGKFYVWKMPELKRVLGDRTEHVARYFSATDSGNWEHGNNILMRREPLEDFLQLIGQTPAGWEAELTAAKTALLAERGKRTAPALDDKIITSWNGLMIAGLTDAYKATGDAAYLAAAEKCMRFIHTRLRQGDVLYRSYKGKPSSTAGFLDDYAAVIQACLRLYQVTFNESYLQQAEAFTHQVMNTFFDPDEGFFYYSAQKNETLITRKKEIFDNVVPSSNSMMARNLHLLGTLVDNEEWKRIAEEMTLSVADLIRAEPHYMANWAIALLELKTPLAEVAFVGPDAVGLAREYHRQFLPFSVSIGGEASSRVPLLANKDAINGKTTVYVCVNKVCKLPVHTVEEARSQVLGFLEKR